MVFGGSHETRRNGGMIEDKVMGIDVREYYTAFLNGFPELVHHQVALEKLIDRLVYWYEKDKEVEFLKFYTTSPVRSPGEYKYRDIHPSGPYLRVRVKLNGRQRFLWWCDWRGRWLYS